MHFEFRTKNGLCWIIIKCKKIQTSNHHPDVMLKLLVASDEFSVRGIKPFSFRGLKVMFQGTIRNDDF